jgi:hypothetical protein
MPTPAATAEKPAPPLLAALGSQRDRYASANDVQKYSGIAPVTECDGKKKWVHFEDCDNGSEKVKTRTEGGQLTHQSPNRLPQVVEKMVRPERFELPTFWFVVKFPRICYSLS